MPLEPLALPLETLAPPLETPLQLKKVLTLAYPFSPPCRQPPVWPPRVVPLVVGRDVSIRRLFLRLFSPLSDLLPACVQFILMGRFLFLVEQVFRRDALAAILPLRFFQGFGRPRVTFDSIRYVVEGFFGGRVRRRSVDKRRFIQLARPILNAVVLRGGRAVLPTRHEFPQHHGDHPVGTLAEPAIGGGLER